MVHGFRGDHHGLEAIALAMVRIDPTCHVVIADLPGFGESFVQSTDELSLAFFAGWLEALVAYVRGEVHQNVALLGHSFGSLIVSLAISQGLSASKVVLVNPISTPALEGPQLIMTKLAIAYYAVSNRLPESLARAMLSQPAIVRVMSEFMAKTKNRELRRKIHAEHKAYFSSFQDSSRLLQAFRASVSHTVTEYAESFDMPTLILAGDRDDIAPLTGQQELANRITQSTLHIAPSVGHLIHYEAHDWAASQIVAFMQQPEDDQS